MALMHTNVAASAPQQDGWVAPGFEDVHAEFDRNFLERGEIGAAVAAFWRGEKVVDLWGGRRIPTGDAPWNPYTMVVVNSTTKGLAAMTIGLYMQELIRRVDPAHRTLGRFFADEIARPLQIEFYIGLPPDIPDERLAPLKPYSPMRGLAALRTTPFGMVMRVVWPWSLLRKSMLFADMPINDRRALEVEIPAGNGVGTARAIARAYSAFAEGGEELGITPATLAALTEPHDVEPRKDAVMGSPDSLSLGYLRPGPELIFGSSERAFGTPGAGGSFAYADPDARLGYAYVMNNLNYYFFDDPREKALRDAVHASIRRLSG